MCKKTGKRVAECYGHGFYVSKKIVTWEIQLMTKRYIEEVKQGCHTKFHSWFNDKKVQLAVHKCISLFKDKLSAQKLAKAVGDYWSSQIVTNTVQEILERESTLNKNNIKLLPFGLQIKIWIVWN